MKLIAITGSIATGKSFVLELFSDLGVPIFNCDKEIHRILETDAEVIKWVKQKFPEAILKNVINRKILGNIVFKKIGPKLGKNSIKELESMLYPSLYDKETQFMKENIKKPVLALEVPLLYEKGGEKKYDVVVVTSAPKHIQETRVMSRGMTKEKFESILEHQLSNIIKINKGDYVLDTQFDKEILMEQVKFILRRLNDL